jgi:prephenate dehydrogenase
MLHRIAILGTGLLGTSVGLALREAGFTGVITGWNRTPAGAEQALAMRAIDAVASDPIQAAREAELTLIAVPIYATLDFMEQLSAALTPDQLVTDVGSTKSEIVASAQRLYNQPNRPAFLPGHPMAGKERGGADLGEAALFRNAVWIFTDDPAAQRTPAAATLVEDWRHWVQRIGSRVLSIAPDRHDEMVAWVSHLPQFTATALSALLEDEVGEAPELRDVGGRALREMTRLGASPFSMWRDIAYTNTAAIERALLKLEQRLQYLRENLKTPALREQWEQANKFRKEQ